jgi:hypothetical protein
LLDASLSLVNITRYPISNNSISHQTIFKMKASVAAAIIAFATAVAAGPSKAAPMNFFSLNKRASLPIPASKGSETLDAAMEVTDFDGGMKTYGRGVSCTGQAEGGDSDAVFIVKDGGSLSNVIIGEDQIEGVHCEGSCTITNVWWAAVCEGKPTLLHHAQRSNANI